MICTFYSYKGGSGRTAALVNLAELCYYAGLRVLVIDWDLSAPGLESHFPTLDHIQAQEQPGLLDMLWAYKEVMSADPEKAPGALAPPSHYLLPVYDVDFGPGSLHLLTAGRRPSDQPTAYGQALLAFDWREFYDIWEGERYLDWLRTQWEGLADIILIDSCAGLSAMGNVCTYHLADVVVMLCTPDQPSLQGAYHMAQGFTATKVRRARAARPLKVIVAPARIVEEAGSAYLAESKAAFMNCFSAQHFAAAGDLITTEEAVWALRIPQAPLGAMTDPLLARLSLRARYAGIDHAYRLLLDQLVQQAPANTRIHSFIKPHLLQRQPTPNGDSAPAGVVAADAYHLPLNALVKSCCELNLRPTPGYSNKAPHEIRPAAAGVYGQILDGPQTVDGLRWWLIQCTVAPAQESRRPPLPANQTKIRGWVAEKSPNGVSQLQRVDIELSSGEMRLLIQFI